MVPVVAALALPSWRDEIVRAALWTSWPVSAAGIAWADRQAPARRSPWVAAALGAVLVVGGLSASVRDVDDAERRAFAHALGQALSAIVAAAPSTVVAEDTRVDTALVAWGATADLQRVRPVPRLVDDAFASGRTVLAGPTARTALELWGFRFTTRARLAAAGGVFDGGGHRPSPLRAGRRSPGGSCQGSSTPDVWACTFRPAPVSSRS